MFLSNEQTAIFWIFPLHRNAASRANEKKNGEEQRDSERKIKKWKKKKKCKN